MSTVYGPVPSWRFGRSLGIDVITPPKKCTFNCVYCQLGKTEIYIPRSEDLAEPLVGVKEVLADLEKTMKQIDLNTVDIVTISGMGEPTLNPELGKIAIKVKKRIRNIPLAVLTNSSLLHVEDVKKTLSQFDLVVAKLDAGDDETLQLINRPADKGLDIETIIDSIKKLKKEVKADLALEVMLLSSEYGKVINVEGNPLRKLLDAILNIEPDLVQLEVPYRPPSESFVRPPPREKIKLISKELTGVLGEDKLWVYGLHDRRGKQVSWRSHTSLEREVLDILKRRPSRIVDVSTSLGIDLPTAKKLLKLLEKKNRITTKMMKEEKYFLIA